VQGWAWDGVAGATVAASTDQHFDGVQSLKGTLASAPEGGTAPNNVLLFADNSTLWPGTVVTLHAFFPTGFPTTGVYFQAYSQSNGFKLFDTNGNGGTRTITPGSWSTWTYTIPNTFPGGLQRIGFQMGDNTAGTTIAGTSFYLDAITASGGVQNCATGTGTGSYDFEPGEAGAFTLDSNVFQIDNNPPNANVAAISASTDQASSGTGSWKVAFTGLPASTTGSANVRNVYINNPNIFCGQTATFHVFMPTGSDGVSFKIYVQYNAYAKFVSMAPASITRNGFTTATLAVPSDVGPGGIQRLGVQFSNDRGVPDGGTGDGGADAGTNDFTGNAYIDNITW
jgi:hypothetical protein